MSNILKFLYNGRLRHESVINPGTASPLRVCWRCGRWTAVVAPPCPCYIVPANKWMEGAKLRGYRKGYIWCIFHVTKRIVRRRAPLFPHSRSIVAEWGEFTPDYFSALLIAWGGGAHDDGWWRWRRRRRGRLYTGRCWESSFWRSHLTSNCYFIQT